MTRQSLLSRRQILTIVGTGSTVALAGCSENGSNGEGESSPEDSDQSSSETQTEQEQDQTASTENGEINLTQQWKFSTDSRGVASPSVHDGVAYTGDLDGVIHAVDTTSGEEQWSKNVGSLSRAPVVFDTVVYAPSNNGVYALDAETGEQQWVFEGIAGREEAQRPLVGDDKLYVGIGTLDANSEGRVYGLRRSNGEQVWQYDGLRQTGGGASRVVSGKESVIFTSFTGKVLTAVNQSDGSQQWSVDGLGETVSVDAAPAVGQNAVFFIHEGANAEYGPGVVRAIDPTNGSTTWTFDLGKRSQAPPTVANGTVYVGTDDGWLYALNAADGEKRWEYQIQTGGNIRAKPTVSNGRIYVGIEKYTPTGNTAGAVHAFNTAGDKIGKIDLPSVIGRPPEGIRAQPIVRDERIYIGTLDGSLFALSIN